MLLLMRRHVAGESQHRHLAKVRLDGRRPLVVGESEQETDQFAAPQSEGSDLISRRQASPGQQVAVCALVQSEMDTVGAYQPVPNPRRNDQITSADVPEDFQRRPVIGSWATTELGLT